MARRLERAGGKILLPLDHIATDRFDAETQTAGTPVTVPGAEIPCSLLGLDIGPKTIRTFTDIIATAGTIVWNGPMGVAELPEYAAGTEALATAVAEATDRGAISIIGGGDSAAAVEKCGLASRMSHVSTGGGASLAILEGCPMPALEVLMKGVPASGGTRF